MGTNKLVLQIRHSGNLHRTNTIITAKFCGTVPLIFLNKTNITYEVI